MNRVDDGPFQFVLVDRWSSESQFLHGLHEVDQVYVRREGQRFELRHGLGDGQVRQVHRRDIDDHVLSAFDGTRMRGGRLGSRRAGARMARR